MHALASLELPVPEHFIPPIVKEKKRGMAAFRAYNWYFWWMHEYLKGVRGVFLTPCAATKPIHASPLHRSIYQKYAVVYGEGKEVLVVSEPVVLIRYQDLYNYERTFCYDFPPQLLNVDSRDLFVRRLRMLLSGKVVEGCLPRHHASLVNDAVGLGWKNHWEGGMFSMSRKASCLRK